MEQALLLRQPGRLVEIEVQEDPFQGQQVAQVVLHQLQAQVLQEKVDQKQEVHLALEASLVVQVVLPALEASQAWQAFLVEQEVLLALVAFLVEQVVLPVLEASLVVQVVLLA